MCSVNIAEADDVINGEDYEGGEPGMIWKVSRFYRVSGQSLYGGTQGLLTDWGRQASEVCR